MSRSYIGVSEEPVNALMPVLGQNIFVCLTGTVLAICLFIALRQWWSRKDDTFLILLLSGMACVLLEAFATTLIKCTHAPIGSYAVYSAFGKVIPLHMMFAYGAFFGGSSYLLLMKLRDKPRPTVFWGAYAIIAILNVAIEVTAIQMGVWMYYDTQPFVVADYPLYTAFMNASLDMAFAAVGLLWLGSFKNARRWLLLIVAPLVATGVYTAQALPIAAAFYGDTTPAQARLGGLATIAVSLLVAVLAKQAIFALQRQRAAFGSQQSAVDPRQNASEPLTRALG